MSDATVVGCHWRLVRQCWTGSKLPVAPMIVSSSPRNMTMRHRVERHAFTLIELLVVVAIISLLIAIAVPSFTQARRQVRSTRCLNNLRCVFVASNMYADQNGSLPPLNNDPNEGAWQYNYILFDGRDFNQNFGPLFVGSKVIDHVQQLFCPLQENPFHQLGTPQNPWPTVPNMDTRAGYGRRPHLTGKSFSSMRKVVAYAADLLHQPDVVRSAHRTFVNVVFTDGHAQRGREPKLLDNALASPFSALDNPVVQELWEALDRATGR
ncbi:putative major pilin subunit [Phycisphaerae bacterium RAS1]|nr:putative major pilin subunit [Phycisphaerae bacterium RAS1]